MLIAIGSLVHESRRHIETELTDNLGFKCNALINSLTIFFEIFVCVLRDQDYMVFDKNANRSTLLLYVYFSHQVTN